MGLFSKIKKGFKKIFKGVKKVIKKVVKGVKKVVKKISSSKILKALAIAAGVIVTGGAALTAFGGTGALATSNFGTWMMSTSQSVLGGTAFGSAAGKKGITKFLTQAGNFATKTVAKPFGAVGGALGSAARVGANLFDPNQTLFQAGPAKYDASGKLIFGDTPTLDTASYAPKPFSGSAFSGQTVTDTTNIVYDEAGVYYDTKTKTALTESQVDRLPASFRSGKDITAQSGFRQAAGRVGETVAGSVLSGVAAQYIAGDPEPQGSMSGAAYEGGEYMDPLKVYAAQQGINTDDIYSHMMYGNQDPSSQYGNQLYQQQTFGVA